MHRTASLEPGRLAVHVLSRGDGPRRQPAGSGRSDARVQAILASHVGLHYNLSHSGDWLYLALSTGPVGVDLESCSRRLHGMAFRRYLLARADPCVPVPPVAPGSPDEQVLAVRIWSRLEALTKCQGVGLAGSLEGLRVPAGPLSQPCGIDTANGRHWLVDLPSPPGTVASLAALRPFHEIALHAPHAPTGQVPFLPTAPMTFKSEE